MMKQILLRVSPVFAKVRFGKFTQLLGRYFLSMRQVTLPQNPLDPDVDWERAEPLVRKKHHAICDLLAYAGQSTQFLSKIRIRKPGPCLEITFAGTDELRSGAQVFGAITELTFA